MVAVVDRVQSNFVWGIRLYDSLKMLIGYSLHMRDVSKVDRYLLEFTQNVFLKWIFNIYRNNLMIFFNDDINYFTSLLNGDWFNHFFTFRNNMLFLLSSLRGNSYRQNLDGSYSRLFLYFSRLGLYWDLLNLSRFWLK